MAQVIPAILEKEFSQIQRKIALVEPYVNWVQIDVSDGNFAPNVTWNNPEDLQNLDASLFIEVHLMISNPEKYLDAWISSGAKRIIVHIGGVSEERSHTLQDDLFHSVLDMAKQVRDQGLEFGIALNPEVAISVIEDLIPKADLILFLAVAPGWGGQKFKEIVLEKIKSLRKSHPEVKIEVDGGITPETGKKCIEAGADILVSGSYIFNSEDIQKAIDDLKSL